jgi:hypothetical protein
MVGCLAQQLLSGQRIGPNTTLLKQDQFAHLLSTNRVAIQPIEVT